MKVDLQNKLFKYFTDVLAYIILQAKRDGKWDMGILDLGAGGENVKIIKTVNFVGSQASGTAKTTLHTVSLVATYWEFLI
jgi:predicted RNA methylase